MGYNDEIKIFNGILEGDEQILKNFYKKNFTIIRSFVTKNSGTEKDSEDVFQDALVVIYQKLKSNSLATIQCSIHTYFYGVCKNIWSVRLRKKQKISSCESIDDLVLEMKETILDDIEQRDKELLFRKYFSNLNCKCKKILLLFFEGKSMKEIGLKINSSEGYARKKKFECKKILTEMIENDPLFSELSVAKDKLGEIKRIVS